MRYKVYYDRDFLKAFNNLNEAEHFIRKMRQMCDGAYTINYVDDNKVERTVDSEVLYETVEECEVDFSQDDDTINEEE